MDVDMVAPARPSQLESERLDEPLHVGEGDVRELAASHPRKQPPRVHVATLLIETDDRASRRGSDRLVAEPHDPAECVDDVRPRFLAGGSAVSHLFLYPLVSGYAAPLSVVAPERKPYQTEISASLLPSSLS